MRNLVILLFVGLIMPLSMVNGQSVRILDVDPSNYPTISAEFKTLDASNNDPRSKNVADYRIIDPNNDQQILRIECPENISAFSIILVIDRSQSMVSNSLVTPTKNAAKAFVDKLPQGRSECAVMSFSHGQPAVEVIHNFSSDKKSLKDSIDRITFRGGTDYNAAFLGDRYGNIGALTMATKAKYKPIIIFLTDGGHDIQTSGQFQKSVVIDSALKPGINATIYSIALGDEANEASLNDLANISSATGGELYRNITPQQIEVIYLEILRRADASNYPPPCKIFWIAECKSGNVELVWKASSGDVSSTFKYNIPETVKPAWELSNHSRNIFFLNVNPNSPPGYRDTTITIKAKNNLALITGLTGNSRWTIVKPTMPMSTPVAKDGTVEITLRYTPTDSNCRQSNSAFEGTACSGNELNLSAGYVFSKNVVMPSEERGKTVREKKTGVFCNWTCEPIKITGRGIKGDNAADFGYSSGVDIGRTIQPGECIDIEFAFTPSEMGPRKAIFEIKASGNHFSETSFEAEITGNGIGNPRIQGVNSVDFENADCEFPSKELMIKIRNVGGSQLDISTLTIDPSDGTFNFVGTNPAPLSIAAGEDYDLPIMFAPSSRGTHNATLKILSNAENNPSFEITLQGELDTIDISSSQYSVDFGVICPDTPTKKTIRLTNSGNIDANINATIALPYTIPSSNFTIPGNNGYYDMEITFNSNTGGDFNDVLKITDTKCGIVKNINLNGKVETPKIATGTLTITSTIGVPTQGTLRITNTSGRDIIIDDLIPQDAQFRIIGNVKGTTIPAGGSIDVIIEYLPTTSDVVSTYLEFYGQPCDFADLNSLELIGNPDKAIARLRIANNHISLIGSTITIPVILTDKLQFAESGTATISTEISFDPTLLEGIAPYPSGNIPDNNTGIWKLTNISTASNNIPENIAQLNFRVKSNSLNNCSDLIFNQSATSNDKGNVTFLFDDGRFCIIEASAELSIADDLKAEPGQVFDLVFYLSNANNLSASVHQGISAEISYNASLFEPWDNTPKGTFDPVSKQRTIRFDNIPINETAVAKTAVASFKFRAMLGTDEATDITLSDAFVKNGAVIFNPSPGKFTLDGICRTGETARLFNPYNTPQIISISPNPTDYVANISFNIPEKSSILMVLIDIYGSQSIILADRVFEAGINDIRFDASGLSTGLYFVTMKTIFGTFAAPLEVIK